VHRIQLKGNLFTHHRFLLLNLGPTRPPKIHHLKQHPTRPYAVEISWQAPKRYFVAGELKGYEIILFEIGQTGRINWTLGPETTAAVLGPLKRNTTFCVTILAFDEYGKGPAGDCINITTRDGGKTNNCHIRLQTYRLQTRSWPTNSKGIGLQLFSCLLSLLAYFYCHSITNAVLLLATLNRSVYFINVL